MGRSQPPGLIRYGAYFDIRLVENPSHLGFIVHNPQIGVKDPGTDMGFDAAEAKEAWIISADPAVYLSQPEPAQVLEQRLFAVAGFLD